MNVPVAVDRGGSGRPGRLARGFGAAVILVAAFLASWWLGIAGLADRDAESARELVERGDVAAAISVYSKVSGRLGGGAEGERGVGEAFFTLARRGNPSPALLDRARKHLVKALERSPADMRLLMSIHHVDLLASRTAEGAALAFDRAAALARRYPAEPTLALRFLALAEDVAVTPRLRGLFGDEPRRRAVVDTGAFLAGRGWIPVERYDSLVGSGLFSPAECVSIYGTAITGLWRLSEEAVEGDAWERWRMGIEGLTWTPEKAFFLMSVARRLVNRGKYGPAVSILRQVVDWRPDAASRLLLARTVIASGGSWQEAAELLRQVVEQEPMNLDHRKEYATFLVGHGMYLTAARVIEPVEALAQGDHGMLYLKGRIREAEGRLDEAGTFYGRAAKLLPGNTEYQEGKREGLGRSINFLDTPAFAG